MKVKVNGKNPSTQLSTGSSDLTILILMAAGTVVLHLLTGSRYGIHRDELATLDDARRLAWGFVAYPPVTPFFGRLSLELFGTSITGFRFFAFLAEALAVVLTGLMAHELGGRRGAQVMAAMAAIPFSLAGGALMQYVSFDYVFWVLTAYFVVRLLKSENPRWWLAIGAAVGLGMMSKYTMLFFASGLTIGILATDTRRYLKSKWIWGGLAVSLLIFLPNFLWQAQHHFISLDFLKDIHARDVRLGRTKNFLPDQLELTGLAFPLWMAGLWFVFSRAGKRFRMLGWMYLVPLLIFVVAKGRGYYLAAAYPMLYAAGSVWGEQWVAKLKSPWKTATRGFAWTALTAHMVVFAVLTLPMAPINSAWWRFAVHFQGDYREEIGWPEFVATVAQIRDSLPQADRAKLGILAANYGEAGAVDLYGPQYALPPAISGVNSYFGHAYPSPPPETLIVVGFSQRFVDLNFSSCQVAAHSWNRYDVENEETKDHPNMYVCRGMKQSWPEFWSDFQYFG
jgi:4-amino-4-deoxy-L-arabinose transferase-like glycosyltransferase